MLENRRIGWTCVVDHGGKRVFVRDNNVKAFQRLQRQHHKNFYWTEIYRTFYSIRANPTQGKSIDRGATIRMVALQGGEIEYYLENGDILINQFSYSKTSPKCKSGLYLAHYSTGEQWAVDEVSVPQTNLKAKWRNEHYTALGDDAGDKNRTADYLANQLFMAYSKKVHKATIEESTKPEPFSLYYIADGDYKNPQHGSTLAAIIQQAATTQSQVNWLVHGKAAIAFQNAMISLKKTHGLNSLKTSSARQEIFFSSPVGTQIAKLDKLAEDVGLKRHGEKGYNLNPFYLKSSYISRNAFSEISMAMRLSKAKGQGSLTQLGKGFVAAVNNPVLGLGLAGAAIATGASSLVDRSVAKYLGAAGAGFAARTTLNMIKSSQAIVDGFQALLHSNTGTGRYYFYENPTQLMKAVKNSKTLPELK